MAPELFQSLDCCFSPSRAKENEAWISNVKGFLENHKVGNHVELFETLVRNYSKVVFRMSLKVHILDAPPSYLRREHGCPFRGARRALSSGHVTF
ncbi:unnamed protein product [Larinioides sclopetarius]|uniref:Uncharacterized protein n=1 Tax=Larinioides sclopetarius TaxID=280406 RepID=A0AAV2APZ8_9ARAC